MYEFIDHTADIGLKVTAPSLPELFSSAGQGFTKFLIDGEIANQETVDILLSADSVADLFHDWLAELNYFASVHHKIFCSFHFREITETTLKAVCSGENFDPNRHVYHTEVKAITYHQISVKYNDNQWHAQIFFDL